MFRKVAFAVFLVFVVLSLVFAFRSDRDVTTDSDEAYAYFQEGMKLVDKLYYRQACEQFEKAVAADSSFAMAYARLSGCYEGLGHNDKAKKVWNLAYSLKDLVSDREKLLLDLYQSSMDRDTAKTRQLAEEYIEKYPEHREGYIHLSGLEIRRGNYEAAIELNLKVAEVDPDYANAENMLGYLNYYLGRYDDALRHLEKYSQMAPGEANPHDSRGEILYGLGKYDEAIAEFREAYNINPDFDFALEHMAFAYMELGKKSQMEYCFETLLNRAESVHKRRGLYRGWGNALAAQQEYDSAKAMFNRILDEDPQNTFAMYSLGYVYFLQRDLKKAEATFDTMLAIVDAKVEADPMIAENLEYNRDRRYVDAMLADLRGNLDEAAAAFADVVDMSLVPGYKLRTRYYYADALRRQGKLDLAESELQKNLSTNPNHTRSLLLLADIYQAQGDNQSARSYRRRVMEIWSDADPDFKPLLELRKKIAAGVAVDSRDELLPS